ncbi:PilZ domain-containing protein [Litorilituus sediminis]|uniref:PilZ domain-containing protein n=1 Tax=Litorilituus sediminis TaxID=718192 RepID=A0A4P6P1W0_9GAMM|nr:PilZ domain-containing protein [Litorilituus sediminis]QBG35073.1 PilZ domain-containing protein [Litorilituus sediminis]
MSEKTLEQKLEQYHEFFAIADNFTINLHELTNNKPLSYEEFLATMPLPFKMASEVTTIDQAALRPIQSLSNTASQLVEFLNHQSEKINLLISYILSQQDEPEHRFQGLEFGGGGVMFSAETAFELGQLLEMKIFLLDENCAVYCIGEVIDISQSQALFHHKAIFHFIREDDRETLVRTSLHKQSKQLQRLAQQRDKESKAP